MSYNDRRIPGDLERKPTGHKVVIILTGGAESQKLEVAEATQEAAIARARLLLDAMAAVL